MTTSKKTKDAVAKLSAIAHEGRLKLMRRLIQAGSSGLLAGELARYAGINATTASAQLAVLGHADLVTSKRRGREVVYRANYGAMGGLLRYLMQDCCCDRPEICAPLFKQERRASR